MAKKRKGLIIVLILIMVIMMMQGKKESMASSNLDFLKGKCVDNPTAKIWECTICAGCSDYCLDTLSGTCQSTYPDCGYTTEVWDCITGGNGGSGDTCTDYDDSEPISSPSTSSFLTDSYTKETYAGGGSGINNDYCVDDYTLAEYYCPADYTDLKIKDCRDFGINYICDYGKCSEKITPPPNICTEEIFYNPPDSYLQRGTVSTSTDSKTDECLVGGSLKDYHCSNGDGNEGDIVYDIFDCETIQGANGYPMVCDTGKCIEGEPPECSDTDGGKDITVKGIVTLAGYVEESIDHCIDENNQEVTSSDRLIEYYCGPVTYSYQIFTCTCSNGKCVDVPDCSEGQITATCICGGIPYTVGWCCNNIWQSTACTIDQTCTQLGGTIKTQSCTSLNMTTMTGATDVDYSTTYCCKSKVVPTEDPCGGACLSFIEKCVKDPGGEYLFEGERYGCKLSSFIWILGIFVAFMMVMGAMGKQKK